MDEHQFTTQKSRRTFFVISFAPRASDATTTLALTVSPFNATTINNNYPTPRIGCNDYSGIDGFSI
jgi:hypothetical protein